MVSITETLENWTLPHRIWKDGSPLPVPLLESLAAVIDEELYVFGGFTYGWRAVADGFKYNLKTDSWERLCDMPTPVNHVNSAVEGHKIWIAGGFVGNHPGKATDEVWYYDAVANHWFPSTPLPQKRAGGGLAIIDWELHYFGGFTEDRDTTCAEHWFMPLDGVHEWMEATPLPAPRGHIATAVVENKIYAMGGQIRHDTNPVDQSSVYRYDNETNIWRQISDLPEPRSHFEAATCIVENYILITGGRNNQNPILVNSNWLDHRHEKLIDDLPLQLFLLLKSKPYSTDVLPEMMIYDTQKDAWQKLGDLPTRLYGPVAKALGHFYVVSGGGRTRHRNVQTRTLLNESVIDLVMKHSFK